MALINCPECNRSNVSDLAEVCPSCGFGIKKHFEMLRRQRIEQQEIEAIRIKEAEEYRRELRNVKEPKKPRVNGGCLLTTILITLFTIFMFSFAYDSITKAIGIIGAMFVLMGLYSIVSEYSSGKQRYRKEYHLYRTNPEEYRRYAANKAIQTRRKIKQREAQQKAEEAAKAIKCPNCGKPTGEQISTLGRVASVGMVGLASSKVGKTYKCSNCEYMW